MWYNKAMETTGKTECKTSCPDFEYKKSLKKKNTGLLNKTIQVERYLLRPLASLLVKAIYNTSITPNQVSTVSFILGLIAIALFTRGTPLYFALGGGLTLCSSVVDCADGQLARAKNMCSEYGAILDIFFDRIIDFGLLSAVSYGVYRATGNADLLLFGLLGAGLYLLQVSLYYLTLKLKKNEQSGETSEAHSFMLLGICIFGLINRLDILIYLVLAETVIVNTVRLFYFIRLGRKYK